MINRMGMCATMEDNTSSIAPKTKIVFSKAILQNKSAKTKKSENKLFFFSAKNFKLESEKKKKSRKPEIFLRLEHLTKYFLAQIFFFFFHFSKKKTFFGLEAY